MAQAATALVPLATHPPVGCFDIILSKAADASLGVIVRENALLRSNVNQKRVISYKATVVAGGSGAKESGPAERNGFLRENDILVGVCGKSVSEIKFDETVNMIRNAPAQLHLRVMRPQLFPQFKGVGMASSVFPPEVIAGLVAFPFAAVIHDGHGSVHAYGPFASASEAAAAYDCVVLTAYGTRAAAHTNAYIHLTAAVARAEINAAHAAAVADWDAVVTHLSAAGMEPYTYAGTGFIAPPPLQHRMLQVASGESVPVSWSDFAPGASIRYHVRAATAEEVAARSHAVAAPAALAARFPGLALLGDRAYTLSQWSRESIPISSQTNELIRAGVIAGVPEADIAHAAFSAVDTEDDGAGHADVAPLPVAAASLPAGVVHRLCTELRLPPAALLDELDGVAWVIDPAALRAIGYALAPNGLPLPLLQAPWAPKFDVTGDDAVRAQTSLREDLWASAVQRNGAPRADRVRCVEPTLLYRVCAPTPGALNTAASVILPSPFAPLPAGSALVSATAARAAESVRPWALHPSAQAQLKAAGGDIDTRHSVFKNVHWDRKRVGAYTVLRFSDARRETLVQDGTEAGAYPVVVNHYRSAVQAALAYDRIMRRIHGKDAVTHFSSDPKVQSQMLTVAWTHTVAGRPELFGVDASALFATGSPLIDRSQVTDASPCMLQSAMQATPPGSTLSRLPMGMLVSAVTSPHMNPLAHLIVMPMSAPPPAPPPVLQYDDAAAMLLAAGITEAMAAEDQALIRATVTPEQREVIRQQIMIMKLLMKNEVPAPGTVSLATRFTEPAMRARLTQILNGDNDARFGAGRSGNRTRTGKVFTGRKKRKYKKRAADDDDDDVEDEDLDDSDSEAEGWEGARSAGGSIRRSVRERKLQAGEEGGADDIEEGDGESGDDKRDGPRRRRSKKRNGALDEDGEPAAEEAPAGEQWRIDVILAARYADLPTEEVIDPSLSEEEQAKKHDAIQLRLRQALPLSMRREWSTLEFMVRWKGLSYLHVEWVTSALVKEQGTWGVIKARKFSASADCARQLDEEEERMAAGRDPPPNESYFDEDLIAVERIIASKEVTAEEAGATEGDLSEMRTMFLVKWRALGYSECTWERSEDIKDDTKVALFRRYDTRPLDDAIAKYDSSGHDVRPPASDFHHLTESPAFKEGRCLRDYQLEGVNWLVHNWYHRRNCILADEMGLGKTVQSVALLEHLRSNAGVRGPFLVLAPLSTLGHWKREFDEWTDMHTVYYHEPLGGATARSMIREHEWRFSGPAGARLAAQGVYKFNTIITSYHVLLSDWEFFEPIRWRYVIVDEAHSLKNRESQLQQALQVMRYDSLLLLTGTPLQNDVQELWALLNLIRPDQFASLGHFVAQYGELKDSAQVMKLQRELAPIMLRRAKEDVEKSIPPKEETLINVELTRLQKAYYRAVLERNRGFLMRGAGSNTASLVNVEMELRKCCDHPFLLKGAEARETMHCTTREERVDAMVAASGKMVLLDKLFPKLRAEGHRVLIFSQFKTMLSLIEELLSTRGYKYERIDGSIRGNERQAAIDRYNVAGSDIFAFLLSTKAGGQGINLTTADTVIIFDSDWNPQNDVQAMARAHRIGQTKDVSIYRLLTAKTYEAEMFRRASRKLGLSQAVFESGGVSKNFAEDGEGQELSGLLAMDKEKVEALLRFGAYAIMDDDDANAAAAQFQSSTIDQILSKSATIRYEEGGVAGAEGEDEEEGAAGGAAGAGRRRKSGINLSKATFAVEEGDKLDVQDPSFWEKVLGPKAGDSVLAALRAGVLNDPVKTLQWTADLTALLDDVFEARCNGTAHDAADSLQTLLTELLSVGSSVPHPLSAEGRARIPADTPVDFPDPTVTLNTVLQAETLVAARMRARAANGRGSPPDVDGDGEQHKGTFATFAEYWMDRVEQGRRSRKRVRGELPVAMMAGSGSSRGGAVAGRGRGRSTGAGTSSAPFRGSRHGYDDDDFMFDDDVGPVGNGGGAGSDDDYVSAAGKKRSRSSAVVARETQDEGEDEVKEVNGVLLPSVSHLRIRLTPVVAPSGHFTPTVIALGPQSKNAYARPSAWTPEHVRRPQAEIDAAASAPDGDAAGDTTDAAAAAVSAQGAAPVAAKLLGSVLDAGQRARLSGYRNLLMPVGMLARTGFTQAEMIAAATAGNTVADVAADARLADATISPEASQQLSALLADQAACPAFAEAEKARAVRVKAWLRTNLDDAAPNPVPRMPAPTPSTDPSMLTVPVLPYRVACVYSANSSRVMKPVDSKGPRGMAPAWVTQGISADVNDQMKRAARKAAQNARRAAQRLSARAAAAAAVSHATDAMDVDDAEDAEDDGAGEEYMDEDEEPTRAGTMPAPDDAFCCVCNSVEGSDTNPIVVCDGCNIAVHRLCYGITAIPPGREPYFCAVCTTRRQEKARPGGNVVTPVPDALPCALCNLTGGAYKQVATTEPTRVYAAGKPAFPAKDWAHVVCALWSPTVSFGETATMEPVQGCAAARASPEWNMTCSICKTASAGVCLKCCSAACDTRFHAMCARRANQRLDITRSGQMRAYCAAHTAPAVAPPPAASTSVAGEAGAAAGGPTRIRFAV